MRKSAVRTYAPSLVIALVIAALWLFAAGRGADVHANLQDSRLIFPAGKEASGESYGVMNEGPALTLRSGWFTLHYEIETDGHNAIRLTTTNNAGITPSVIEVGPDSGSGTVRVHAVDELYNLQILCDYRDGTYMRVKRIDWTGDKCTDRLFTVSFALAGAAILLALHRNGWLTRRRRGELVILAAAVLIACIPNLKENLSGGHDFIFHTDRLLNLVNALRCGQFPARMGTYICSRFGAPTSAYYPELFLYIPAGMMIAGASTIYAIHVFFIGMHAATALIMRLSAGRLFKNANAGTIAAVLYTLSVYRLTDAYTRFAVGEALAMCFLPLFIYAMHEVIFGDRRRFMLLAVSAAAIYESHVLSAAICLAASVAVCAVFIVPVVRGRRLLPLLGAGVCAVLLCVWSLLPVLTYNEQGVVTYALVRRPQEHAIAPAQLLMDAAGTGETLDDKTLKDHGVTLGWPLIVAAAAAVYVAAAGEKRMRGDGLAAVLVLGGAVFALCATTLFPWGTLTDITRGMIGYIQFPWRLLMPASALLAMAGGWGLARIAADRHAQMQLAVLALCTAAVMPMLTQYTRMNGFAVPSRMVGWGDNFEDYILNGTSAQTMKDPTVHADGGIEVTDYEKAGSMIAAHVRADAQGVVSFPVFGFRGYAAELDGEAIEVFAGEENRLSVALDAGEEGELRIRFEGVPLWRAGEAVSAATALGMAACALARRRRRAA